MNDKTILVVEDNELNMKLVRSLLKLGGYKILEAENGGKGIQLAQEHHPDLILMDIQLPDIDGLQVTKIIKADPELKKTRVIALTSYAMRGDEERAREAQCDGYLAKPINTRTFLETIESLFNHNGDENQQSGGAYSRHKSRILIVDDEPMNIKLLRAKLPKEEYEIIEASNGTEAIEKVKGEYPDLIILDIMMPDMDGYEVTRRLKQDPETEQIPIIQVTALDTMEDKVKGLEAGADEFLNRPVNATELLARIHSLLRLKRYREQLTVRKQSEEFFPLAKGIPLWKEEAWDVPRILLVEDNEKDALLIQNYLRGGGYHITLVRTGEESLVRIEQEKFDLILLDVLLPGLNGFEVCERLKEIGQTRDIQVVLITSLQDLESKIRGVEMGADDYLIKPLNSRELQARINVLLKKKAYLDKLHADYETALNSAVNDGLTGLYNNAYFKRFLELELKRSTRLGYPLALMMIDIDDFKNFNDTLGHVTGDIILKELAQLLKKTVREIDLVARYGGDEFAVVLPYADKEMAVQVAERIQTAISLHPFPQEASSLPKKINLSLGIAFPPSIVPLSEEFIRQADLALYQAKREGKNRYNVFEN